MNLLTQETEQQRGTLPEFVKARWGSFQSKSEGQRQAFIKEWEAMIVQLVCDEENGFGEIARHMLPRTRDLASDKIDLWLFKLQFWYCKILTEREREKILNTEFCWS